MIATSYHIIVEDNPAIIYASRNGQPEKVLPTLTRFLAKFWQERDASGEVSDTPECLVAQIIVRFGFEMAEDDYSNLRVGVNYYRPEVDYLYWVGHRSEAPSNSVHGNRADSNSADDNSADDNTKNHHANRTVQVWVPGDSYRQNPSQGLKSCRQIAMQPL